MPDGQIDEIDASEEGGWAVGVYAAGAPAIDELAVLVCCQGGCLLSQVSGRGVGGGGVVWSWLGGAVFGDY